jgi:uncharacterized protein DUF1833
MTVPNWAAAELIRSTSDDPIVVNLTISHPRWGTPQRLTTDKNQVVSNGQTFEPAAFDLTVVSDEDRPPQASLAIPNVDRNIGKELRKLDSYPECTIEVVALSTPDEPIYSAHRLQVLDPEISPWTVSATLKGKDYAQEQCGTKRIIPRDFPAFFIGN